MVIVSFDVLTSRTSPHGFALLKTIRKFQECDAYVGFDLHTEDTIAAFEKCLLEFDAQLKVSRKAAIFAYANTVHRTISQYPKSMRKQQASPGISQR